MSHILVLNGPNLNLLGLREVNHYGAVTLDEIEEQLQLFADELGHELHFIQHNHEGTLIDLIHEAFRHRIDFIIFNPGAYTHTSIALRDALLAVRIPFIEIHLSNIYARESYRHHSYFSDIAMGQISGFGPHSYELALIAAHRHLSCKQQTEENDDESHLPLEEDAAYDEKDRNRQDLSGIQATNASLAERKIQDEGVRIKAKRNPFFNTKKQAFQRNILLRKTGYRNRHVKREQTDTNTLDKSSS